MVGVSPLIASLHVWMSTARSVPWARQTPDLNLDVVHGDDDIVPLINADFPDPSIIRDHDGTWYAFATERNVDGVRTHVQVARADGDDPLTSQWTVLDTDAMPESTWSTGVNNWAPDVRILPDDSYVLYYSGEAPESPHRHCIGVARSNAITGPYKPDPNPWECDLDRGGAIDASGFQEGDRMYVVYKVDGNSATDEPTPCGTFVDDPNMRTPLVLQRVDPKDGSTRIGEPKELLNRIPAEDGALIEAPNLVRRKDGMYVLWYSSHCFTDPKYDVKYAYSENIEGPYTRGRPMLQAPDYGLDAPGGMTSSRNGDGEDFIVFHGNCDAGGRCMYGVEYDEV